jgi:hypothetical protein
MSDSAGVHQAHRRPPPLLSRLLSEAGGLGAGSPSLDPRNLAGSI